MSLCLTFDQKIKVARRIRFRVQKYLNLYKLLYVFVSSGCSRGSTSRSCRQCGKKYVCPIKTTLDRSISFISDISIVSYNIRLTKKGQLATFLYSRLAHKEATGNSAYFFEYKPHLTYSFKVACPSKEQVHEERVEVVIFRPNIWTKTSSKHLDNSFHIPPLF